MDLQYTASQQAFRQEVRGWLEAHVPQSPLASLDTEDGFAQHREWERTLASGNWSMVTWPTEYGGRGCDLIEWLIFEEEYYRAGAPVRANQNGVFLLGPTLMEYGTHEQKRRFLGKMATGEEVWAQVWSEPGAGSDMAAIRTTARRNGDHYIINGQKIWSTRAVFADWGFGLFRTDPASERHHGISFILVPLDTPGITVRPIPQLNGLPGFAEIFFDDVKVSAENLIGGENQGWHIAMATAGFERGLMLRSPARFQQTAKNLVELYRKHQHDILDLTVHDEVVKCYIEAEAYTLATYQTASRLIAGEKIGAEASLNKIFWSELDQRMHQTALSILGPHGELQHSASAHTENVNSHSEEFNSLVDWLDGFLFSQSGPIYAGANEIQRNIAAERLLGMPR